MAEEHRVQEPRLCANNCGFFGSTSTQNLCSKCFRDLQHQHENTSSAKHALNQTFSAATASPAKHALNQTFSATTSPAKHALNQTFSAVPAAAAASSSVSPPDLKLEVRETNSEKRALVESDEEEKEKEEETAPPPMTQDPKRCLTCRRRVGITGFRCRCGFVFCGTHRYAEQHECSFDFKRVGKEKIAKANPIVKAEKLEKI